MNFHLSVFLEKNFFKNIREKVRFGGNYPLLLTLSDQSNDSKNCFNKFRAIYATNLWGCKKI